MQRIALPLLFALFAANLFGQNPNCYASQSFVYNDPAKFDYLTGCTEVEGHLNITGSAINTLAPLRRVKKIVGSLYLHDIPNLFNINDLDSLVEVTGDLQISNAPGITTLAGLKNLKAVGGIFNIQNTAVASLAPLKNCAKVGTLWVQDNPNLADFGGGFQNLAHIPGELWLYQNPVLAKLTGLENLRAVGGSMNLNIPAVQDLLPLSNLDSVGDELNIGPSQFLPDLSGLAGVQFVKNRIVISGNAALTSLEGFPKIADFPGSIGISQNLSLKNCRGLEHLRHAGGLALFENKGMETFNGLEHLRALDTWLSISANAALVSFAGLDSLETIGQTFDVADNPALPHFSGLGHLSRIGDFVRVQGNASLLDFAGLEKLGSIGGQLIVQHNPSLKSFAGMGKLSNIGGYFWADHNVSLEDFSGLENLRGIGGDFVAAFDSSLRDFSGLSALDSLPANFRVESNANLRSLDGLSSLKSIGRNFLLAHNPALTQFGNLSKLAGIDADFYVVDNYKLLNFNSLSNLASVGDSFIVTQNQSLQNLSGLGQLRRVGGPFQLAGNIGLQSTDGLGSLQTVGRELYIAANPALLRVSDLGNLEKIGTHLRIVVNDTLQVVEDFEKLDSLGGLLQYAENRQLKYLGNFKRLRKIPSLAILTMHSLADLRGLDSLVLIAGDATFLQTDSLANFHGLENVRSLGGMLLVENRRLVNFEGLDNLETIRGGLYLNANPAVKNMQGLGKLKSIGDGISCADNAQLESLRGLSNLGQINGVALQNNPMLSDCAILAICDQLLNLNGTNVSIQNNAFGCNTKAEIEANCHSRPVRVSVRLDTDADCLPGPADLRLSDAQIELNGPAQRTFRPTNASGETLFRYLDAGAFELSLPHFPSQFWSVCAEPLAFLPDTIPADTIEAALLLSPVQLCPALDVKMGLPPRLRNCLVESPIDITVQNLGAVEAESVRLAFVVPPVLEMMDSDPPLLSQNGDTLFFGTATLAPFQKFALKMHFRTRCDTFLLGQTLCLEAFASMGNACPTTLPAHSEIKLHAECRGDTSVRFTLRNIGDAPTQAAHEFKIFRNGGLLQKQAFSLAAQARFFVDLPADGATYRMEATQNDAGGRTAIALENCRGLTPGQVNAFWIDDGPANQAFGCREVVLAFDPNQKTALPSGFGADHLIEANQRLTYTIEFQNTGTDTAFRVLLRDELGPNLDLRTFQPRNASHPFAWEIRGRLLEVTFYPIFLPDSNANEAASHGFFTFEIEQKPGLPDGTALENTASIIFDFNPPILTNTVLHRIGRLSVGTSTPPQQADLWELWGNPMGETATFRTKTFIAGEKRFELRDAAGRTRRVATFAGQSLEFRREALPGGVYFFKITDAQGRAFVGKIAVVE